MTVASVAVLALAAPVVQSLLMGVVGYPLAKRLPGGMEAFRRSGFTWWLIALAVIAAVGLVLAPDLLSATEPSPHDVGALRVVVTAGAVVVAVLALELAADALFRGQHLGNSQGYRRYVTALPAWASGRMSESALVAVLGVLEEAVYRGLALGGLLVAFDLVEPLAAGIVAAAFGLGHWWFGPWQIVLKSLVGAAYVAAALSSGWVVAAACHVVVNLIVVAVNHRRGLRAEFATANA